MTIPYAAQLDDTIAALASAPGAAGRGIVRVSGVSVSAVVAGLVTPWNVQSRTPSRHVGEVRLPGLACPLPVAVYYWPTRRSFTGQPLAEFHLVGSPPLLDALLTELFARGVRPAHPGEFTLRAFLAGRLDLPQAEAVLGVIDARDDREMQQALDQLAGGLSTQLLRLRGDLLDLLADLEAGLDFADEAIEFVSQAALVGRLGLVRDAVAQLLQRADRRMRNAVSPRIVLAGPPNAGKSTLFNALLGSGRALVSPEAGTTRDYLSAPLQLAEMTVELVDTAGRAEAEHGIDDLAQRLAQEQAERAQLVVWCEPADVEPDSMAQSAAVPSHWLRVVTKGDLVSRHQFDTDVVVSVRAGSGLDQLRHILVEKLVKQPRAEGSLLDTTAARSFNSLTQALAALERAVGIARQESDQELLAIEVRDALDELGKIAGAVYTDDILDRIFSKFCIGK